MFDIGWVEMMVVIIVLIIVIGPKDLPVVLHTMGQWVARARAMARSFQDSIEEMARDSGIDEVREDMRSIRDFRLDETVEKTIDPEGEFREGIAGGGEDARKREKAGADAEAAERVGAGPSESEDAVADRGGDARKPPVDPDRPAGDGRAGPEGEGGAARREKQP